MSSITGEIGYKVHASGATTPHVNTLNVIGTMSISGTCTIDGQVIIAPTNVTGTDTAALRVVANRRAPAILCTSYGNAAVGAAYALQVQGTGVTGFSYGLEIFAGSNASDQAIDVGPASQSSLRFFQIFGDGSGRAGPQTASNKGISWGTGGAVKIDATNAVSNGIALVTVAAAGTDIFQAQIANVLRFAVTAQDGAVTLGTSTVYAWGTGTKYPVIQFAGIGGIMGTDTMGLVTMGGGLYYNGTSYIYGQAGTGVQMALGTGSFTVSCFNTSGTAAGTATPTVVFSIGGTVTSNKIQGYGPSKAALVDMTPDQGSFVGTYVGVSPAVQITSVWARVGNIVVINLNAVNTSLTGTSNSTSFSMTGLPAAITPTQSQTISVPFFKDAGADTGGAALIQSNGTFVFFKGNTGVSASWTASGQKGFDGCATITYLLNNG